MVSCKSLQAQTGTSPCWWCALVLTKFYSNKARLRFPYLLAQAMGLCPHIWRKEKPWCWLQWLPFVLKHFQPNLFSWQQLKSDAYTSYGGWIIAKRGCTWLPHVVTRAGVVQSHGPQMSFSPLSPLLFFSNLISLSCMDSGGSFHRLVLTGSPWTRDLYSVFSQGRYEGWLLPGAATTAKLPLYIPQIPAWCV